jgi:antitoxin ParD1/3/4
MAIVKTTLSLTDLDRQWMNGMIASGEYVSNSEYVRNLIRKDKEQRSELDAIRARLITAEQSGFINQNRDEILAEFKGALRSDGKL